MRSFDNLKLWNLTRAFSCMNANIRKMARGQALLSRTLFCPELLGAARVLDFNIQDSISPTRTSPCKAIGPGLCLEDQTRALRCVLATNQQSRAFAKVKFPDELRLESDDGDELTLCVNLKTDIAMLDPAPDFSYQDAATPKRRRSKEN
ncbi:hypothetical protein ACQRIT_000808 [Beauveria bassiana]